MAVFETRHGEHVSVLLCGPSVTRWIYIGVWSNGQRLWMPYYMVTDSDEWKIGRWKSDTNWFEAISFTCTINVVVSWKSFPQQLWVVTGRVDLTLTWLLETWQGPAALALRPSKRMLGASFFGVHSPKLCLQYGSKLSTQFSFVAAETDQSWPSPSLEIASEFFPDSGLPSRMHWCTRPGPHPLPSRCSTQRSRACRAARPQGHWFWRVFISFHGPSISITCDMRLRANVNGMAKLLMQPLWTVRWLKDQHWDAHALVGYRRSIRGSLPH